MLKSELKIMITGGGSGGHLSVAKSVIDSLITDYNMPVENIIYVGGDLGMEGEQIGNSLEMKAFKESKFKKYFIRAGKLQRKIFINTIFPRYSFVKRIFEPPPKTKKLFASKYFCISIFEKSSPLSKVNTDVALTSTPNVFNFARDTSFCILITLSIYQKRKKQ